MTRYKNSNFVPPLGILPPPIGPLDGRWTASLIKRDIKNMYKSEKASIKAAIQNVFGSSKANTNVNPAYASAAELLRAHLNLDSASKNKTNQSTKKKGNDDSVAGDNINIKVKVAEKDTAVKQGDIRMKNEYKDGAKTIKKKESKHSQKLSVDTTDTVMSSVATKPTSPTSTCNTDMGIHEAMPPVPKVPTSIPTAPEDNSYYDLMSDKLAAWYDDYKNERIGLTHEERFRHLGTLKFFRAVLECHASNPSYNQFRGNTPDPTQHALLLSLLRKYLSSETSTAANSIGSELDMQPEDQRIPSPLSQDSAQVVSSLPSIVYSQRAANAIRIDSAHSDVAPTIWQASQNQGLGKATDCDAVSRRWTAITAGLTNRSTTIHAIEALMHELWPYLDVDAYIVRIGDPAKGFGDEEDTKLRERMRPLLYPEYEQLFMCN
jgi:hypothetical protein